MQTKAVQTKEMSDGIVWKKVIGTGAGAGAAVLCSAFPIMGCYPLVPAYAAAQSMERKGNLWIYIGMGIGMAHFMGLTDVVKYTLTALLTVMGIRFYLWANRRIGGFMAGFIAAFAVLAMNASGMLFMMPDRNELIRSVSESLMVLGITVLFHHLFAFLPGFFAHADIEKEPGEKSFHPPETDRRMEAFATAFGGLSDAFAGMGQAKKMDASGDLALLQKEVTGKLCASCDGCAVCWAKEQTGGVENIHRLLAAVCAHKPKEELIREQYVTDCPNYAEMVDEAVSAFSRMELNRAWYARLMENRILIAQQLDAMTDMMEEWVRGSACLDKKYRMQLARIQFEGKERGLTADQVHVFQDENGHLYIRGMVCTKWGGAVPVKNYIRAVSDAMGQNFCAAKDTRALVTRMPEEIVLYEEARYFVLPGIAAKKKDDSVMSGDSFLTRTMDGGRYVAAISDGMGSGIAANRESEMVVELLDKFLEAGFRKETAIRMMNSAMVLQGENNEFSTLDLAALDLYTGELSLTKIGAAAAFIKHGDHVECIPSGTLPAGASCEILPEETRKMLVAGDFLVMVTDGVVEYLHVREPEKTLCGILEEIQTENAGVLAKELMERVMLYTGGYAADDMTILVTGLWKK